MSASAFRHAFAERGLLAPRVEAEVDSTNRVARELASQGASHGQAVIALRQTAGRGRLGRSWLSSERGSLCLSIVLRPNLSPARLGTVALAAGVALAEACGPPARLKWPNDLVAPDRRKIAGILAEAELGAGRVRFLLLGIGINVADAPDRLPATHLGALRPPPEPAVLAAALTEGLLRWAAQAERDPDPVRDAWLRHDATLGQRVRVGERVGLATGLRADGGLELTDDLGQVSVVHAGDVELVAPL